MNLSFSTRGWSDLSFEEWIDTALDMRFTGIEVYNLQKFPALEGRGGPFHKYNAAATVRLLREKKLKIPCLDSSWDLSTGEEAEEGVRHLLETAHNLQVPYVSACALRDGEETVRGPLRACSPRPRGWGSPSSSRPAASIRIPPASAPSWTNSPATTWALSGISTTPTATGARALTPPSKTWAPTSAMSTSGTPTTPIPTTSSARVPCPWTR